MPNIAAVIKEEVTRLARKEVKAQTEKLRKSATESRRSIAQLRQTVKDLERKIKTLEQHKPQPESEGNGKARKVRFSPKMVKSNRERLDLSAAELGKLLGVSAQTVYNWEQGKARPRQQQLESFAGVRSMGKREARARLQELSG